MAIITSDKLQQVFINLLLNATQACTKDGQIIVSAGQDADHVWVEIRDNGCGITDGLKSKVFDPFFTTKAPGKGTGLGLAVCHRVVEEAGERIEMESTEGEGSCFRVILKTAADE